MSFGVQLHRCLESVPVEGKVNQKDEFGKVFGQCVGMRFRAYIKTEGGPVKALDELVTEVVLTGCDHFMVIKTGPYRVRPELRMFGGGNTFDRKELVLLRDSLTMKLFLWRGNTYLVFTAG